MNLDEARSNMIEQQVRPWDVLDQRVLDALALVPREEFVAPEHRGIAYSDFALPIGHGRRMLKPVLDGRVLQAIELDPTESVVEIGTGSGYLSACLARLGRHVDTLEIVPELAASAAERLDRLGIPNVRVHTGDAARGPDAIGAAATGSRSDDPSAPRRWDAIVFGGSVGEIPTAWKERLAPGGCLFAVVGDPSAPTMEARLLTRTDEDAWHEQSLFETTLAPLAGFARPPARFVF